MQMSHRTRLILRVAWELLQDDYRAFEHEAPPEMVDVEAVLQARSVLEIFAESGLLDPRQMLALKVVDLCWVTHWERWNAWAAEAHRLDTPPESFTGHWWWRPIGEEAELNAGRLLLGEVA